METNNALERKENDVANQRNNMPNGPIQRQTAFKLKIMELLGGNIIANDKFRFLELDNKKIMRVNIIANVIDKFISEGEKKYAGLTLDDASGQIRVKTFGEDISKFEGVEIGDTLEVIGMLRYFNNELYILPEIIKSLDPKWLIVRKLELGKDSESLGEAAQAGEQGQKNLNTGGSEGKKEVNEKSEIKNKILESLKSNTEGVDIDEIIMSISFDTEAINQVITEMLEDAEIYEPKPGRIRLL